MKKMLVISMIALAAVLIASCSLGNARVFYIIRTTTPGSTQIVPTIDYLDASGATVHLTNVRLNWGTAPASLPSGTMMQLTAPAGTLYIEDTTNLNSVTGTGSITYTVP